MFNSVILRYPLLVLVMIHIISCSENGSRPSQTDTGGSVNAGAKYVGREHCIACHQKEYELFEGSDHDMAMDSANDQTVLADFNDATFTHHGITSRFYRDGNRYYVNTEGPDGHPKSPTPASGFY